MALRLAYLICSLGSSFAPFTGWRSFRPPKPRQGAQPLETRNIFNELPYFTCKHDKQKTQWGPSTRAVEFYFGMFFSVALSGLKSLEIYDPGVPLTLHPRLYTVALSGLSSQAAICFFESTIRSSIFRTRRPCYSPKAIRAF